MVAALTTTWLSVCEGKIFRSTTDGRSWQLAFTSPDWPYLSFAKPAYGGNGVWCVLDGPSMYTRDEDAIKLYKSEDDGITWEVVYTLDSSVYWMVEFTGDRNGHWFMHPHSGGYPAGADVYKSSDGSTWTEAIMFGTDSLYYDEFYGCSGAGVHAYRQFIRASREIPSNELEATEESLIIAPSIYLALQSQTPHPDCDEPNHLMPNHVYVSYDFGSSFSVIPETEQFDNVYAAMFTVTKGQQWRVCGCQQANPCAYLLASSEAPGGYFETVDGGSTFTYGSIGADMGDITVPHAARTQDGVWFATVTLSGYSPRTKYLVKSDTLFGWSFTVISAIGPDIDVCGYISCNENTILVGAAGGNYVSGDSGVTWRYEALPGASTGYAFSNYGDTTYNCPQATVKAGFDVSFV